MLVELVETAKNTETFSPGVRLAVNAGCHSDVGGDLFVIGVGGEHRRCAFGKEPRTAAGFTTVAPEVTKAGLVSGAVANAERLSATETARSEVLEFARLVAQLFRVKTQQFIGFNLAVNHDSQAGYKFTLLTHNQEGGQELWQLQDSSVNNRRETVAPPG